MKKHRNIRVNATSGVAFICFIFFFFSNCRWGTPPPPASSAPRAKQPQQAMGPRHHSIAYSLVNYAYTADKLGYEQRALEMVSRPTRSSRSTTAPRTQPPPRLCSPSRNNNSP